MQTFSEKDLCSVLEGRKREIVGRVTGNESEADIERLVKDFTIEPIVFDESGLTMSDREEMIPAERFPNGFWVDPGKRYPKTVVRFHVPFSGERELFRCKPSTFIMRTEEVSIDNNELSFDVINWSNDAAQVKSAMESVMKYLREQNGHVTDEVKKFNDGLKAHVTAAVAAAKDKKGKNDDFMSSLGVPRRPHRN